MNISMDFSAGHTIPSIEEPSELFWDWIDCDAQDINFPSASTTGLASTNTGLTWTSYSPEEHNFASPVTAAFALPPELMGPDPESPTRGARVPARKDAGKRREQNRAAQRAYRDRQKVLVDGLLAQVQDLTTRLKQQSTKCELLESMCKRLATENDVYREFLKLDRNS